jgi:hypothetical protein
MHRGMACFGITPVVGSAPYRPTFALAYRPLRIARFVVLQREHVYRTTICERSGPTETKRIGAPASSSMRRR